MTYEEIGQVLEIDGKEVEVYMPNELFEDLQNLMKDSSHIAYAYSYLYLVHFLYRNCKYFNVKVLLDNNMLKQILGYSKSNRTMNYITQKDVGLLDSNRFTESTKDYPTAWEFDSHSGEDLSFTTYLNLGEMKDLLPPVPKMFFLKYPNKALEDRTVMKKVRVDKDYIEEEVEVRGTFFDVENTTRVDFNIFMFCMGNNKLGVIAFYFYSWMKYKCEAHGGSYSIPITELAKEMGISRGLITKYMDLLKGYKMISFQHNMDLFCVAANEEDRLATTYCTNEYDLFSDEYLEYKKMGVQLRLDYIEMKAREENDRRDRERVSSKASKKANIPNSELPF